MRPAALLLTLALLTPACANSMTPTTQATSSPVPSSGSSASPPADDGGGSTPEHRTRTEKAAARLVNVNGNFYDLLDVWLAETAGKPRGRKFRELKVLGLRKQIMMRRLVRNKKLGRGVLPLLPSGLRLEAKRNIKASRDIYKLTPPQKPSYTMKTSPPSGPRKLLRLYAKAERRFGVPWSILAGINLVESRMGRINGPSSAGALGPMQFMPATWDAYGKGDPFNTHNAIMAAARYLSANGAPNDLRNALWNYNHSDYYVDGILAYHRQMSAKPLSYYSYYFWQVFVRTTKGDKQLTGPRL